MILTKDEAVAVLATAAALDGHVTVRVNSGTTPESTQIDFWLNGSATVRTMSAGQTERCETYRTRAEMAAMYEVVL